MSETRFDARRRQLLATFAAAGLIGFGPRLWGKSAGSPRVAGLPSRLRLDGLAPGRLRGPDANGLRLLPGYSSRIIARAGEPVAPSGHLWHDFPDGGAVFAQPDGGWIYVSNAEVSGAQGGASALRFDAQGRVIDAYPILAGTSRNCAGGRTPWGTWLSGEEHDAGLIWECPVTRGGIAHAVPAMGTFAHEAAAYDPPSQCFYLTEDKPDGRLYRFKPLATGSLQAGVLEAMLVHPGDPNGPRFFDWVPVSNPNPTGTQTPTRYQVPDAAVFNGGEGIWAHDDAVYFTTKGDNRVWRFRTGTRQIEVFYDAAWFANPVLTGVDNIVVASDGTALVAEDGGDMQVVALDQRGGVWPFLQVVGQDGSELTGPAFSPDGTRFYVSSQRGPSAQGGTRGVTYEIRLVDPLDALFSDDFE